MHNERNIDSENNLTYYKPPPLTQTTALHLAALQFDSKEIRCLINNGVDVNAIDGRGRTPLCYIMLYTSRFIRMTNWDLEISKIKIMELLLNAGADMNIADCDGNTPLKLAINKNYLNIASMLIKRTPYYISLTCENVFQFLSPLEIAINFLLEHDPSFNTKRLMSVSELRNFIDLKLLSTIYKFNHNLCNILLKVNLKQFSFKIIDLEQTAENEVSPLMKKHCHNNICNIITLDKTIRSVCNTNSKSIFNEYGVPQELCLRIFSTAYSNIEHTFDYTVFIKVIHIYYDLRDNDSLRSKPFSNSKYNRNDLICDIYRTLIDSSEASRDIVKI